MTLAIGTLGAGILLVFFISNQFGKLHSQSFIYHLGNFVGATLLAYYAYVIGSWPFFVIEVLWAFVAVKDIVFASKKKNNES